MLAQRTLAWTGVAAGLTWMLLASFGGGYEEGIRARDTLTHMADQGNPASFPPPGTVKFTTSGGPDTYIPMVTIPEGPGKFAVVTFTIGSADQSDPNSASYVAFGTFTGFNVSGPDVNAFVKMEDDTAGLDVSVLQGGEGDTIGLEVGTPDMGVDIRHTLSWSVQWVPAP